jgi:tRNA(fMet)-specific endonuclease VapC
MTLLDSDILSAILSGQQGALYKAKDYLRKNSQLSFSTITEFEVLRGLKWKNADRQIDRFVQVCHTSDIRPVTSAIVEIASNIHVALRRNGVLIGDADILIAATAIAADCPLATNNVRHFSRIDGLRIENWMA